MVPSLENLWMQISMPRPLRQDPTRQRETRCRARGALATLMTIHRPYCRHYRRDIGRSLRIWERIPGPDSGPGYENRACFSPIVAAHSGAGFGLIDDARGGSTRRENASRRHDHFSFFTNTVFVFTNTAPPFSTPKLVYLPSPHSRPCHAPILRNRDTFH